MVKHNIRKATSLLLLFCGVYVNNCVNNFALVLLSKAMDLVHKVIKIFILCLLHLKLCSIFSISYKVNSNLLNWVHLSLLKSHLVCCPYVVVCLHQGLWFYYTQFLFCSCQCMCPTCQSKVLEEVHLLKVNNKKSLRLCSNVYLVQQTLKMEQQKDFVPKFLEQTKVYTVEEHLLSLSNLIWGHAPDCKDTNKSLCKYAFPQSCQ